MGFLRFDMWNVSRATEARSYLCTRRTEREGLLSPAHPAITGIAPSTDRRDPGRLSVYRTKAPWKWVYCIFKKATTALWGCRGWKCEYEPVKIYFFYSFFIGLGFYVSVNSELWILYYFICTLLASDESSFGTATAQLEEKQKLRLDVQKNFMPLQQRLHCSPRLSRKSVKAKNLILPHFKVHARVPRASPHSPQEEPLLPVSLCARGLLEIHAHFSVSSCLCGKWSAPSEIPIVLRSVSSAWLGVERMGGWLASAGSKGSLGARSSACWRLSGQVLDILTHFLWALYPLRWKLWRSIVGFSFCYSSIAALSFKKPVFNVERV